MKHFGPTPQLLVSTPSVTNSAAAHLELVADFLLKSAAWKDQNWDKATLAHPDITIINQDDSGIKIEQVRQLLTNSSYPPYQATQRVIALLQLDQASAPAQQALLKFLEEPPSYLQVIATTTQLSAILPTIQSRCQLSFTTTTETSSTTTTEHSELIDLLLSGKLSHAEAIKFAEGYSDRPEALAFLDQLLTELRSNQNYPSQQATLVAQEIYDHWLRLHQNTNVRLTLEDCFFRVISRF